MSSYVDAITELLRTADGRELIAGSRYRVCLASGPDGPRLEVAFCAEAWHALADAMTIQEYTLGLRELEDGCVRAARCAVDKRAVADAVVRVGQACSGEVFDYLVTPVYVESCRSAGVCAASIHA